MNINDTTNYCGFSVSSVNMGTQFSSAYAWNMNGDRDGDTVTPTSTNQHVLSFTATAPGSYRLDIAVSRAGDLNRINDTGGAGAASFTAMNGVSDVMLASGSLNLSAQSLASGSTTTSTDVAASTNAVIGPRLSNGVGQSHALTFSWSGSVTSSGNERRSASDR